MCHGRLGGSAGLESPDTGLREINEYRFPEWRESNHKAAARNDLKTAEAFGANVAEVVKAVKG